MRAKVKEKNKFKLLELLSELKDLFVILVWNKIHSTYTNDYSLVGYKCWESLQNKFVSQVDKQTDRQPMPLLELHLELIFWEKLIH